MSRPYEWSPLSGSDPVPGDTWEVRALARDLRKVAEAIADQSEKLRTLCSDDYWEADAARTFDETAKSTGTKLQKAYQRYEAAAEAVEGYLPTLEAEQETSLRLLTEAQHLDGERRLAQHRLDADEPDSERPGRAYDQSVVDTYAADLQRLRNQVDDCADRVRDAGRRAAGHLAMAIDGDGLKDGRFDGVKKWLHDRKEAFKDWLHEHADWLTKIADIAGWIATAAGIAALLVGWIPVIGQALAAVLGAVALLATAVSLICHLALYWTGDGGLFDIGMDAVALLTFGIGRAAIGGIRGGVAAVRASGKLTKAASTMAPAILAKGGRAEAAVMDALSSGDLREAAQLSGLRRSVLKGMMGSRLGGLSHSFGDGGFRRLEQVLHQAPGSVFSGSGHYLDAFRPSVWRSMVGEVGEQARAVPAAWRANLGPDFMSGVRTLASHWRDVPSFATSHVSLLEHDLAAELRNTETLTQGLSSTSLHETYHGLRLQMGRFTANTVIATGLDAVNHTPVFDGLKHWGTRAAR